MLKDMERHLWISKVSLKEECILAMDTLDTLFKRISELFKRLNILNGKGHVFRFKLLQRTWGFPDPRGNRGDTT